MIMDTTNEDDVICIETQAAPNNVPVETIDLAEDLSSPRKPDPDVSIMEPKTNTLQWIHTENKTLSDIIEKCLDLEYSEGMLNILESVLVRAYKNLDETYKKSSKFEKVLTKALKVLDTDPKHKFVHVKNLYETFQAHSKKRVPLISCPPDAALKRKITNAKEKQNGTKQSKNNNEIIDLDEDPQTNKNVEPNSVDSDIVIVQESNEQMCAENVDIRDRSIYKNGSKLLRALSITGPKENVDSTQIAPITDQYATKNKEKANTPIECINISESDIDEKENKNQNCTLLKQVTEDFFNNIEQPLFIEVPVVFEQRIDMKEKRIKELRSQIKTWKDRVVQLEQEEVDFTTDSSYLKVDRIKSNIVHLYKELCQLTGNKPFKQPTIRLKVIDGHPGPVKVLEEYLNNNMSSTGEIYFPDLSEVVKCVELASANDCLRWSRQEIMNEAYCLFKECGRNLKKRRMKREWRDMMDTVDSAPLDDPADTDPVLKARLDENKRYAEKKEKSIIDRYVTKAEQLLKSNQNREIPVNQNLPSNTELQTSTTRDISDSPIENDLSIENSLNDSLIITKTDMESKISLLNTLSEKLNTIVNSSTESTEMKTEYNLQCKSEDVIIKKEPEFTLPELGDNYTFTLSVEDPFMVVEISSDEEDEVV